MKKILSTRVLVKICVLTTILLVLIIYTIWGNSALMVSMVNISSDRIPSAFSNFRIAQVSDLHNAEFGESNTELIELDVYKRQPYNHSWVRLPMERGVYMSLYQDRQIKGFLLFLTLFALLFVGTATVLTIYQVNDAEVLWLKHDEAVSSSLLEQGVPKEVVAVAFTNTDISDDGRSLLAAAGLGKQSESSMRPYFNQFQRCLLYTSAPICRPIPGIVKMGESI